MSAWRDAVTYMSVFTFFGDKNNGFYRRDPPICGLSFSRELPCLLMILEGNSVCPPTFWIKSSLKDVLRVVIQFVARFTQPGMFRYVEQRFEIQ